MASSIKTFFTLSSQAGVIVSTADHQIMEVNSSFCKLTGYLENELVGQSIDGILQGIDCEVKEGNFETWLINSQSITIKLFCRVIPCDKDEFLVMVEHSIVSHEKNATQSLKDNLLLLSNHLDDVVWTMDLDGKITFVSYQITDLIGYLPTEMMQMHFSQILTPASYKNAITILNNELEIARNANQKSNIRPLTRLNLEQVRKDGSTIWTEVLVSSIWDGSGKVIELMGITKNISQQIEIKKALVDSEAKFKSIFLNTPMGVFYYDQQGVLLDCNFQFEKIIGSPREKLIGLNLLSGLTDTTMPVAIKQALEQGSASFEGNYLTTTSNRLIPVRVNIQSLTDQDGKRYGAIGIVDDISERVKSEQAIRNSEFKFRSLFENSPLALIYFNKDGALLDCNAKFLDMIQLDQSKIKEISVFQLFKDEHFSQQLRKSLTDGSGLYSGKSYTFSGQNKVDLRVHFQGLADEYGNYSSGIAIIEDLSDWIKTEQEIQKQSEKLVLAIQAAGFGLWEFDIKNALISISPEFLDLISVDHSFQQTDASKWLDIIHPDDFQNVKDQLRKYIKGEIPQYLVEYRIKLKNGTYRWLLSTGKIDEYDENNQPVRLTGVHSDITKLRRIEEELMEKNNEIALQNEEYVAINEELQESFIRIQNINQELIVAKNKAEENDKLKTAFLQNMSHEIRTPMNGIMGFAQLLELDHSSAEKRKEYVKIINESCYQLLNIVNDILDISRIETGQMAIILKQTDIGQLLEHLLQLHKPAAAAHHLQIFLNAPINKPLVINTDPDKLKQILNNLISNAIKYTNVGSVHFGYRTIEGFIEFYVKDTGFGIKPENFQSIFERFIQTHNTATKRYAGTGLGLPISKGLVNLLGGTIWVESEVGQGSTFYFTIPSGQHDTIQTKVQTDTSFSILPTILVAEDQESNYFLIKEMLQNANYNIIWASDGIQAVEKFRQNPQVVLVLMDIKMPNMDGYEAARIIRDINAEIPIIAQTAYAMIEDREKAIEAGCTDYISKPFNKQSLISIINKYLLPVKD